MNKFWKASKGSVLSSILHQSTEVSLAHFCLCQMDEKKLLKSSWPIWKKCNLYDRSWWENEQVLEGVQRLSSELRIKNVPNGGWGPWEGLYFMFERPQATRHYTCAGLSGREPPNTTPVHVSALTNRQAPFGTFSNDPKFPHRDSFRTTFFDAWAHAGMEHTIWNILEWT